VGEKRKSYSKGGELKMLKKVKKGDFLPAIEKDIDQDRILRWAKISGDFNRLHVDQEYAKQTRFGGTIAHGPLSLAFLNELMMDAFGMGWAAGGRLLDVRFIAPIRPGERIRIGGQIRQIVEEKEKLSVECDLFIEKPNGEKAVIGRGIGFLSLGEK
jgi:3-hydroxybutyryl-CoA dehydratase